MRRLIPANLFRCAAFALALMAVTLPAAAQTEGGSSGGSQTTQTTQTTRTTSQPTTVEVSHVTQRVDPVWIGVGAIALVALLAILLLAARGRGSDRTTVVRETTVRRE